MPVRETLTGNTPEAEQAAQAIAAAAETLGFDLPPIAFVGFAVAALSSFDRHITVEEGVSAGVWADETSRAAVRRRLRDLAAVNALDDGYTVIAHAEELVEGLGTLSETVDLSEAHTVLVQHHYPARRLMPGGLTRA